jgi:hypothetical protein
VQTGEPTSAEREAPLLQILQGASQDPGGPSKEIGSLGGGRFGIWNLGSAHDVVGRFFPERVPGCDASGGRSFRWNDVGPNRDGRRGFGTSPNQGEAQQREAGEDLPHPEFRTGAARRPLRS